MMHCYAKHSSYTAAVEYLYLLVKLELGESPGTIKSPEKDVDAGSNVEAEADVRDILRYLKSSLPRALKLLDAARYLEFGVLVQPRWT